MEEIWKPIPNCDGYFVSNLGRFKNAVGEIKQPHGKKDWYQQINLKPYGGLYVHRLIALTFIPNPENKSDVNHINGIKDDNRVENLEWVTHQENIQHAWRTGLTKGNTGKHFSEEALKHMSEARRGHEVSEETRKKMSESLKDRQFSEETRRRMSEAKKGKHFTEETRKRIGEVHKDRIWVNNGLENHIVKPDKLQEYLNNGYVKGRKLLVG